MQTRVAIIQGSPRADGNTERAARRLAEGLGHRFAVTLTNLYALDIRRCTGCRSCMTEGLCVIRDDDFPALWADLRQAEMIVQACPVYWHAPPGIMKDFIDRTHSTYPHKSYLRSKLAYLVTVGADSGFETCEIVMRSWITAYGGNVLGTARLYARDRGELDRNPENLRKLDELVASMMSAA